MPLIWSFESHCLKKKHYAKCPSTGESYEDRVEQEVISSVPKSDCQRRIAMTVRILKQRCGCFSGKPE